jgi:hypothetical protein
MDRKPAENAKLVDASAPTLYHRSTTRHAGCRQNEGRSHQRTLRERTDSTEPRQSTRAKLCDSRRISIDERPTRLALASVGGAHTAKPLVNERRPTSP